MEENFQRRGFNKSKFRRIIYNTKVFVAKKKEKEEENGQMGNKTKPC